jgi:hypothetical protein
MLYGGAIFKNEEYRKLSSFSKIQPIQKSNLTLPSTYLHSKINPSVHNYWDGNMHYVLGITEYLKRVRFYLFFRIFRLANPYMRKGSLKNAFVKSGPLTSLIRRDFLMIWMICDRS